jgi:GNAT superfamily N-acetyltransferase
MIKVTESREKDIEAMRNLFFKTRVTTFSWNDTSKFKLSDFEKETENEYILVALANEVLVGFISVWTADNFIHHLYVDRKFQNQGIGTHLLIAVLDKFGYPIKLKCEEKNKKAFDFYKQKGFSEIEKGQSENGTYILFELNRRIE